MGAEREVFCGAAREVKAERGFGEEAKRRRWGWWLAGGLDGILMAFGMGSVYGVGVGVCMNLGWGLGGVMVLVGLYCWWVGMG